MRFFFKVRGFALFGLAILAAFLGSCNVPAPLPTDTPTPELTATPSPTRTPFITPTPTETPIPAYLEVDPEAGTFTLLVREGTVPEGNLDLAVTVAPEGERTKVTATLSHNPADGRPTFGSRLYGLFLAGFARLTVLALFYGILLGVSFIFPGRNFWVPAIPPAILFISMIVRAIKVRRRLPKRIDRFFCDFCGCTPVSAPPRA